MFNPGWNPRFALYTIGDREVGVGARPTPDLGNELNFEKSNVDPYISVTTREPTWYKDQPVQWTWAPFVECQPVRLETLCIAFNALNSFWKRAYIHCDLGSNRAPVVFGLWLRTFFPNEAEEICKNRTLHNHGGDPENYYSCPFEYSLIEIAQFDRELGKDLTVFLNWARETDELNLESFYSYCRDDFNPNFGEPKWQIEVQPYKDSLWVQRGRLFYTREEADIAVAEFTDGSDTGPWAGARVTKASKWAVQRWEDGSGDEFVSKYAKLSFENQRLKKTLVAIDEELSKPSLIKNVAVGALVRAALEGEQDPENNQD